MNITMTMMMNIMKTIIPSMNQINKKYKKYKKWMNNINL